jgi:hypothetical protein
MYFRLLLARVAKRCLGPAFRRRRQNRGRVVTTLIIRCNERLPK